MEIATHNHTKVGETNVDKVSQLDRRYSSYRRVPNNGIPRRRQDHLGGVRRALLSGQPGDGVYFHPIMPGTEFPRVASFATYPTVVGW
jgi:hypothetical protein